MYESFYGLREKAFVMQPDPYFIYWSDNHHKAYSMLEYGILNAIGFTVITGEIGSGKTTLLQCLLAHLDDATVVGLLNSTSFQETELLQWIMMAFGQKFEGLSNVALFRDFQNFLIEQYSQNRRVILVVDEAQNLSIDVLEQLRMLSNINTHSSQLLQVVLVGQPQLRQLLKSPKLVQFAQRIGSDFHISSLPRDEVEYYIHHRSKTAGATVPLFTPEAAALIADASRGIPRLINLLCDTALVYGYSSQAKIITREIVEEVIAERSNYFTTDNTGAKETLGMQTKNRASEDG
jgi:general secretion pathway protein A